MSEQEQTRRVLAGDHEENVTIHMKCTLSACGHSDSEETEVVDDVNSKKIRDSVEFTSQTHTARQHDFKLDEMDEEMQDELSEALMSELRAIAEGNFILSSDPIQIST